MEKIEDYEEVTGKCGKTLVNSFFFFLVPKRSVKKISMLWPRAQVCNTIVTYFHRKCLAKNGL
jgi:hypothetical protein